MPRERSLTDASGSTSPLVRAAVIAGLLLAVPHAGCVSHSQRRVEAERRWNHVRAQMKYELASQQLQRGRIETAIETVNEAIAADPSSADMFLLLARCHLEKGELVSAQKAAEQARRRAPEAADVDYTLGVIAERGDDLGPALAHYHRARTRDQADADYLVAEAECLTALGRLDEAIALMSANMRHFDSDGTLEMLLGRLCLLAGDKKEALRNLGLAVQRSGCEPANVEDRGGCMVLIEEYGRLLSHMGRDTEAVALLGPYTEAQPDAPPSVVAALCASYLETGRASRARDLLREHVAKHPRNVRCWMLLARASVMTNDWITARRCADQLENLMPETGQAHLLRGYVCWKQGDLQTAIESLQEALASEPNDALAHCLAGQLSEDIGRPPAVARAHYERALKLDPQLAWAKHMLDSYERSTGPPLEMRGAAAPARHQDHGDMLP